MQNGSNTSLMAAIVGQSKHFTMSHSGDWTVQCRLDWEDVETIVFARRALNIQTSVPLIPINTCWKDSD